MAFDLEEQEQMENLKAFWERWGKLIIGLTVLAVVGVLGWKGYAYYLNKQSEKASQIYQTYATALQKKDAAADAMLANLQADYRQSRYTALASLDAAQVALSEQQWDKALVPLQWLLSNGSLENQAVARLQIADILAQTAKNDEALKMLETVPAPEFTIAFANKKADLYLLMNNNAKARESIEAAIKAVQALSVKDAQLEKALQDKLALVPN